MKKTWSLTSDVSWLDLAHTASNLLVRPGSHSISSPAPFFFFFGYTFSPTPLPSFSLPFYPLSCPPTLPVYSGNLVFLPFLDRSMYASLRVLFVT